MTARARSVVLTILIVVTSSIVQGGVFLGVIECDNPLQAPPTLDYCVQAKTQQNQLVKPWGTTHPIGFVKAGDPIVVNICVKPGDDDLVAPTQRAIATWDALKSQVGQCENCFLAEEGEQFPDDQPYHAESAILHDLGHCAMGLDHTNLKWDDPQDAFPNERVSSSFTASYGGNNTLLVDPDGVRGSCDDFHNAPGGDIAEAISWFRKNDNDPVIIDESITIEQSKYTRTWSMLPSPCSWAANGNRKVAEQLGYQKTQSVMYSIVGRRQKYSGLSADDVNMVKLGKTGDDWIAGTMDDYTIDLEYVTDCNQAQIQVEFFPFGTDFGLGSCPADVVVSYPQAGIGMPRHYTAAIEPTEPRFPLTLNSSHPWDYGPPLMLFTNGFESGDTSGWSGTAP